MPPLIHRSLWVVAVFVTAAVVFLWTRQGSDRAAGATDKPTPGEPTRIAGTTPMKTVDRLDQAMRGTLNGDRNPAGLRETLLSAPPAEALAFIRGFLATGTDRATGMEFEIGSGGNLDSWPTLRTMLLDLLPSIDPAAAAQIARDILKSPTTADEWALALRNVGRAEDPETSRDFLRQKTEELIRNPEWQGNPSVGYLNAFDVLVHTEAVESTPLLSSLVQNKERKDLSHAAFLTLDRLVQRQPDEMLDRIAADSALRQSRPEMTAQQFARADLRDERQRDTVAQWLLDPARTTAELRSFAGVFPNHNQFVSNNLLTHDAPVSGEMLAVHDREVLEIVTSWRADPAFEPVAEHLKTIVGRLEQFTGEAPP